jgi:hypothetical protein
MTVVVNFIVPTTNKSVTELFTDIGAAMASVTHTCEEWNMRGMMRTKQAGPYSHPMELVNGTTGETELVAVVYDYSSLTVHDDVTTILTPPDDVQREKMRADAAEEAQENAVIAMIGDNLGISEEQVIELCERIAGRT